MTTTLELSERQQQVLDLLHQDVSARQIGVELGVSRNAVYQTISRLKKMGALPSDYKQSEQGNNNDVTPSRTLLTNLTAENPPDDGDMDVSKRTPGVRPPATPPQRSEESASLSVDLLRELATTQQELAVIANRLARYL